MIADRNDIEFKLNDVFSKINQRKLGKKRLV